MPSALYAISYRPTASVVALCSLEKQDLPDKAAWDRLLATLIGPRLPISLLTSGAPIEIPAYLLGCDLVRPPSQQELEAALAEPYRFQVGLEQEGPTVPELGDGKEKILKPATRYSVASIGFRNTPGEPIGIKVTLSSQLDGETSANLWFDGRGLAQREATATLTAAATPAPTRDLTFALGPNVTLTPGASYGVVLFLAGAPVEARPVRFPAASSSHPAPSPAAAAAFAGASASASGTVSVPSRGTS